MREIKLGGRLFVDKIEINLNQPKLYNSTVEVKGRIQTQRGESSGNPFCVVVTALDQEFYTKIEELVERELEMRFQEYGKTS